MFLQSSTIHAMDFKNVHVLEHWLATYGPYIVTGGILIVVLVIVAVLSAPARQKDSTFRRSCL